VGKFAKVKFQNRFSITGSATLITIQKQKYVEEYAIVSNNKELVVSFLPDFAGSKQKFLLILLTTQLNLWKSLIKGAKYLQSEE